MEARSTSCSSELGRWRELADVRGARAERRRGVDKAALLRAQARAFEQAGERAAAAEVVSSRRSHAPEDVSGLVDYVDVLAREGRGREAAEVLAARVDEALDRGVPAARSRRCSCGSSVMHDEARRARQGEPVLAELFASHARVRAGARAARAAARARAGSARARERCAMRHGGASMDLTGCAR